MLRIIALVLMLVTPMLLGILQVVLLTALQLATLAMAIPPAQPVRRPAAAEVRGKGTILHEMSPSLPAILDELELILFRKGPGSVLWVAKAFPVGFSY